MAKNLVSAARTRRQKMGRLGLWKVAGITTLLVGGSVALGLAKVNSENRTAASSSKSGSYKSIGEYKSLDLPKTISSSVSTAKGVVARSAQMAAAPTRPPSPLPTPSLKPSASVKPSPSAVPSPIPSPIPSPWPSPVPSPTPSPSPIPPTPTFGNFTVISDPSGSAVVQPNAVAPGGRVVGTEYISGLRAFSWTPSDGYQLLGSLPGTDYSEALAINSNSKAAGVSKMSGDGAPDAVTFQYGLVKGLAPAFTSSTANGINESGVSVGSVPISTISRTRVWTDLNNYFDLVMPNGKSSGGYDINSAGNVVGSADFATAVSHAYLWVAGTPVTALSDLGDLPGGENYSNGFALNNNNQVTGFSMSSVGYWEAMRWSKETGMVGLGVLNFPTTTGEMSTGYDINDAGYVVGWSGSNESDACEWDPLPECNNAIVWGPDNTMYDLNQLYPQPNWHYNTATSISNDGYVVGQGYLNGVLKGYRIKMM